MTLPCLDLVASITDTASTDRVDKSESYMVSFEHQSLGQKIILYLQEWLGV